MPACPRTPQRPAALLRGPGHVIVHANDAFRAAFGQACVGLPAVEALLDLPRPAFDLIGLVTREARPLAANVAIGGAACRVVVVPRRDVETGEVYGVALHVIPRRDTVGPDPEVDRDG